MWIICGLYAGYMWSIYGISPKQVRHWIGTGTEQHRASSIDYRVDIWYYIGRNRK
jgi:hypothetical protein